MLTDLLVYQIITLYTLNLHDGFCVQLRHMLYVIYVSMLGKRLITSLKTLSPNTVT